MWESARPYRPLILAPEKLMARLACGSMMHEHGLLFTVLMCCGSSCCILQQCIPDWLIAPRVSKGVSLPYAQMFNWLYDSSTAEEFAEHQTDLQCLLEALHWVFNRASIYHQHNKERGDSLA